MVTRLNLIEMSSIHNILLMVNKSLAACIINFFAVLREEAVRCGLR